MNNSTLIPLAPSSQDNEIILYQSENDNVKLEVRLENDTVWLNRQQIAILFDRDVKTIGKHINNALKEELEGTSVVAKFATTASDGKTYQMEYYKRLMHMEGRIDHRLSEHDNQIKELRSQMDFFVKTSLPPQEGIFFDGQIFDAYNLMCDLIRSAKQRIVMVDNYIDDSVFTQLNKRKAGVTATIFTYEINKALKQDLKRYNAQYAPINIRTYKTAHDRFLIIDDNVYHVGASFKDLGKKLFAFSLMEAMSADELIRHLNMTKSN